MSWRFRKSVKIAPGIKFNVSPKSVGMSVGNKYARRSVSTSGRKTSSFSLPGTGLTHVARTGGGGSSAQPETAL